MIGGLFPTYGIPPRICDAAQINGVSAYLFRITDFSNNADSKKGILSAWYRVDDIHNNNILQLFEIVASLGAFRISLERLDNGAPHINDFALGLENASDANICDLRSTGSNAQSTTWKHVLVAWDLGNSYAKMYVNDVDNTNLLSSSNDTVDCSGVGWQSAHGVFYFNGYGAGGDANVGMAEFYLATGQFLDITVAANRRKFISASGKPVHLGLDGSFPTGVLPLIYLRLNDGETAANIATNRTGNGNYTVGGSMTTASTSPSD